MDYVFFGFSSLCLGFLVLLLFNLARRSGSPLKLWQYLFALACAVLFYFLNVSVFREQLLVYYLFNTLPQMLLFGVLLLLLSKKAPSG